MVTDFLGQELKEGDIIIVGLSRLHRTQEELWLGVVTEVDTEVDTHVKGKAISVVVYGYNNVKPHKIRKFMSNVVKTNILDDTTDLVNLKGGFTNIDHMVDLKLKGLI